jgi:hypothetical protein
VLVATLRRRLAAGIAAPRLTIRQKRPKVRGPREEFELQSPLKWLDSRIFAR